MPPSRITVADLIDEGLVAVNAGLVWRRTSEGGVVRRAKVLSGGRIRLSGGSEFDTPSGAARALTGGSRVDGWRVWRVGEVAGPTLADLRTMFQAGTSASLIDENRGV